MRLSTNRRYQSAKVNTGFDIVHFDSLGELKQIAVFDHSPAIFTDGIRSGKNVVSCDCLALEVDNIDCDISIDEFQSLYFPKLKYWITTSRSHQKEKITGGEASPPRDRYHVFFPMLNPLTKTEYEKLSRSMVEEYRFFDPACTDSSRFFFGNRDVEVFFHDGEHLETNEPELSQPVAVGATWEYDFNSYQSDDKKAIIASSLKLAQASDAFRNYDDWLRLGAALKADGWAVSDWIDLSDSNVNIAEINTKWDSFTGKNNISGATLLHYARMGNPNCLVAGKQSASLPYVAPPSIRSFSENIPQKKSSGEITTSRPTSLDTSPHPAIVQKVRSEILYTYTDENGKVKSDTHDDWFFRVLNYDAELANCIHFDYTIGEKIFERSNTRQLETAVLHRLRHYVPMRKITDRIVTLVINKIEEINGARNQCLELIDKLIDKHEVDQAKPYGWELDEFVSIFEYKSKMESPYPESELDQYYKEVWHLFFLRMHMHLEGTRLVQGDYKYLIPNDIVPILEGAQNIGKTTLCQWIGLKHISTNFYVDLGSGDKGAFGGMNTAKLCRGRLLAELGEMKVMKKSADVETVKSFISKTQYDLDIKYIEKSNPVPVTVSFLGSSNEEENLSDTTGNRRWWPMWIKSINKQWITDNHEHIEKLHAFYARVVRNANVESWFKMLEPSDSLNKFIDIARERSMIRYADYDAIIQVVSDDYINSMSSGRKSHSINWHTIVKLMIIGGYNMQTNKGTVKDAMKQMGYSDCVVSINGHSSRGWKKSYLGQQEVDY